MIDYQHQEEKAVALVFAKALDDQLAESIIEQGFVSSAQEALHLSKFFWAMVNKSAEDSVKLPFEGSGQYWTEKLYNSIGGYLERAGYEDQWNDEMDHA